MIIFVYRAGLAQKTGECKFTNSKEDCVEVHEHVTLKVSCIHLQPGLLEDTMTSYADYVEQIEKLQSLAEAARKDEINGAIKKIRDLMQLHGVTLSDLSDVRAKPAKAKGTVAAQFKNPESGETWTGRGRAPRWLDGKAKEAFRIVT
jgi:DNA-binding protein H-NS